MTSEEREDLRALTVLVNEGFREVRELIESRRKEDHAAHVAIYERIDEQRVELTGKLDEVKTEQATVREDLVGSKAVRKWLIVAAGLLATWMGLVIAAVGVYVGSPS